MYYLEHSMKIKLVSDLHLEFSDINIQNDQDYDVLILGGDIMIAQDLHDHIAADFNPYSAGSFTDLTRKQERVQRFRDFFKRCSFQFPHVIYIMGNHEFYHGKFYAAIDYMRTLWTDMNDRDPLTMNAIKDLMNDFRIIRNDKREYAKMSALDVAIRHDKTLGYIKLIVQEHKDKRCVVVGHHAPSFKSVSEQYASQTLMNGGYASDLSEFIMDHPQIKLWTHGHMHQPFDYVIGETRVVCNPRGYENDDYSEDSGWNPNIVIEI